jgi:hypothetical protein
MIRLPHLPPTAQAQLWGLLVGGSLAVLFINNTGLSWVMFVVGFVGAWLAGEFLFAKRLIGQSDTKAIALAIISGAAFPWAGVAFAALVQALQP